MLQVFDLDDRVRAPGRRRRTRQRGRRNQPQALRVTRRLPTLNWIGKEAVVEHHKEVPFRLLEPVPELSCGESGSGNLIAQGDNLHVLEAVLPAKA